MSSSILQVLTELTALTPTGVVLLKPFRPWFGIPLWRDRTLGIRLLNTKEIEESMEFVQTSATTSQEQSLKMEIVARSLWSIDGSFVVTDEELQEYNHLHKSELTQLEYKRVFVHSFEQYLLDYLYGLYSELQQKQHRKVFGLQQCAICKKSFAEKPKDAHELRFSTAELVCDNCLSNVSEEDHFEFADAVDLKKENPVIQLTLDQKSQPISKVKTPADFPTLEDYRNYLIDLAEKGVPGESTQVQQ